ncbi:histo-blood group ABO system transferase 2-like isoform X1 [Xenopus laevis]|uniref:Histo-blood group ABO system transferase 2-like isoform X1 n=1 Tax=Xenopus laevis TaxID=8355 RepID=A0A8J1MX25_XENLA|nr:histo-blood group ABO system transferase 2-like isoform X1 [Xenopus laevis]XP_041446428.1 histo-blood group ABO system transferase 2-like isoform X1 [Xenopus laevis]XP_041446429.1 histo-blood group ABO system transferase 2-like isoform X1 [Xenopus laevis]XP_041446430.1 histo-blood group ABO system transferase 2-like isoform X1 [Xenopus laevis]XP_041446431.1 histo-blood group ABO system transferase 2-like isoform X1 [Xenopus laevis]
MTAKQWIVGFLIVSMIFLLLFFVIRMQKTQVVFQEKQVEDTKNDDLNDLENLKMEIIQCERKLLLRRPDIRQKAALKVLTPWLAPIIWDGTYDLRILNNQLKGKRIGLFVFAVKKYIRFLLPFLESAEQHFMVGYNVTYYAFTDNTAAVPKISLGAGRILNLLEVEADKRWQDISMKRMQILVNLTHDRLPKEVDYLVCADVDMVFNDHVGVEILGDLVATIHPGLFLAQRDEFTYDRNPESAAYIPYGEGDFYYMAAFYGGTVEEINKLSTFCHKGIVADKKKNIEAVWQEESHFNKYLFYNKPTKVLSPEYIWDTNLPNGDLVKKRRFLAVHKNHEEVRN